MSSIPHPNDRGFVASLAKGLSILSAFEQSDVLGNQELVEITGMPKATVSRFTGTLEKLGYLRFDDQVRKYRVGGRTLNFGSITMQKHGIQRIAAPLMRQLAQTLDVTVLLAQRANTPTCCCWRWSARPSAPSPSTRPWATCWRWRPPPSGWPTWWPPRPTNAPPS
ncbi:IclR family transcriptional regulator [Hydrogenophaga sp. UC242_53]|uniref:IclR family transcriptional regulator n=1 Tax=Hydrogenophaga sp. UC242_53 TaxID=3350170 RepID=UPI0036D2CE5F